MAKAQGGSADKARRWAQTNGQNAVEEFYFAVMVGTGLVLLASFSSLLAFRFGAPLLLLFLLIGLITGVDGLGIDFSNNALAYVLGSIALAVILFDSGYGTSFQAFRMTAIPSLTLATVGVVLTAVLVGLVAMVVLDFSFLEGALLGAIVSSTDAAAVFFLLRIGGIHIREKVRSTLEVESGTNDPMAIFLTMALVHLVTLGEGVSGFNLDLLRLFVEQIGLGLALGLIGGLAIHYVLKRLTLERGLAPILMLAMALMVFAVTGAVGGSGFLAVYVAGIYAGNRKIPSHATISRFQEGITWLAQIIMFLVLGLLATPSQFLSILLPAVLLGLFLVFIARPLAIWLCLLPFDYTQRETGFIGWVGLRGAVSILLGILPIVGGLENGQLYFNTVFIIVVISLVLQGWTIKPMAKRLGLLIPPRIGAIEKIELDLPGAANHELLAYRVAAESPVARGERIPRWARPSLVIREGKSMRFQYAGRLRENDQVYLFIAPGFSRLIDRLFASKAPVGEDDAEFFGTFNISPNRLAKELKQAYGHQKISASEAEMTVAELIESRLGGAADYGDRVRLDTIVLIVSDTDDKGHISKVGISMEPVVPVTNIPIFMSFSAITQRAHQFYRKWRKDWRTR